VDPDVAALVRAERLLDAAGLASERGDAHTASQLYERACAWASASREAMRAGEAARALELAIESGDEALADGALALVEADPARAAAAAAKLSARGRDRWAARLLEATGNVAQAARAWERAGDALRAARLLEEAGEPAAAARALEAALRREPDAWTTAAALGALLLRFGKHEVALRVLQRVPGGVPERREALAHMVPALGKLGLGRAAADAAAELASLGGSPVQPSPTPPATVHARIFGRYDLVREVASSPSARVLECLDLVRSERVAVKVFAGWDARGSGRDALTRFEREVRTMRALDHPNVVPLRDFLPEGPAIVLAWMAGGTLERLLATTAPLVPARAVEIATAVLSALGEAHRLGILHRDVKPANVLFDDAGGARLADFGVAHLSDVSTTATAGVFGTLAYMSPEQREGRPASARSDIFSVGVMLREMLTGERPSPGDAARTAPSQAHRDLDARHDTLVARLAANDPSGRPDDAFEARASLLALEWPTTVDAQGARDRTERRSSAWPRAARLEAGAGDGPAIDTWTGRRVERVALTSGALVRAGAFARADHSALQGVLRVDRQDGTLWLEARGGKAIDRALTPPERSRLQAALDALHAAGCVHGHVDRSHVVLADDGVLLRFDPEQEPTATVDRDRLALARL
jgi:hypothetical protein